MASDSEIEYNSDDEYGSGFNYGDYNFSDDEDVVIRQPKDDSEQLRIQQDFEFYKSLSEDKRKEREKKEEEERIKLVLEEEERKREEVLENIKLKKIELGMITDGDEINICFQIGADKIKEIFFTSQSQKHLYDYVYTLDRGTNFSIFSNFPKTMIDNDKTKLGIFVKNKTVLHVCIED